VSERENDLVANIPNDYFSGWKNDSIQHSAWFMFVAPDGGEVIIDVLNATFDTQMAVFQAAACGDPAYFRQWTFMGANDDITSLGGLNSQLFLKGLEKGKPYKILVDGHNGAMGFFDMKLTIPTPANDEPINAIALQIDAAGQGVFSNGGATSPDAEQVIAPPVVELNKPGGWSDKENDPRARRIERSVWFKFVAPSEGAVKISTCDQENFFVQLAVYKVGNLLDYSTFELIEADDESQFCRRPPSNESPNGRNIRGSIIELTGLTPDSTYYLVVDGSVNSFGQFSIDLLTTPSDPPINDEACKAIELAVDGEVKKGFHNLSASVTDTEEKITPPEWLDGDMKNTVWFTFKAPESQEVEISLCDLANFDTQIAVYEVEDCKLDTNFVLVAANEDGPKNCSTGGDSFLPIKGLTAGKTYYIVVDGYGNNQGIFSILLKDKITPGPANDDVVNAILIPVDGKVKSGFSNAYATVRDKEQDIRPKPATGQPDCVTGWCDNQVDNSVWFKFVAP
ncbi:MAG: hypothetical protein NWP83_11255, partial [Spirosomaceae bacterium]|nr:hypothetical protein [Spirosomataceae bacterium]